MERSSSSTYMMVVVASLAGIAAGSAAALTATAFPYALGVTLNAMRYKRKKEERAERHRLKEKVKRTSVVMSKEGQAYRDAILKCLQDFKDLDVSFEEFPYFLSETTKEALLDSTYIHLKRPEFAKYTSELSSISPRILLTGPPGSELYQEAVVKALARHLQVKLLIFDSTGTCLEAGETLLQAAPRTPPQEGGGSSSSAMPMPVQQPSVAPDPGNASDADVPPGGGEDATPPLEDGGQPSGPPGGLPEPSGRRDSPGLAYSPLLMSSPLLAVNPLAPMPRYASTSVVDQPPPSTSNSQRRSSGGSSSGSGKPPGRHSGSSSSSDGNGASGSKSHKHASFSDVAPPPLGPESASTSGAGGPGVGLDAASPLQSVLPGRSKARRWDSPGSSAMAAAAAAAAAAGLDPRLSPAAFEVGVKRPLRKGAEFLGPPVGLKGRVLLVLEDNPNKVGVRFDKPVYGGNNLVDLCEDGHGFFCPVSELRLESSLVEDADKLLVEALLEDQLAGRMDEVRGEGPKASKMLARLFPTRIPLQLPQDENVLKEWKAQLETDAETLKSETNRQRLRMVLSAANVDCANLAEINVTTQVLTQEVAERVVGWGASHHVQTHAEPAVKDGKLSIAVDSVHHGIKLVQAMQQQGTSGTKRKSLKDVVCDNEFEKVLLAEVIPPDELNVKFEHIGALENVKETLREPVRGLLLFGPPGTGKTMLAKAVATESGANFINVSMSSIASKWFGEAEKYVKAVFTLASKIAPSVIFIDEVDSMLGRRGKDSEHSAMRKVKNELMASWDGLRTREKERVLLLAATNRPFDLDEAVIRRFPRSPNASASRGARPSLLPSLAVSVAPPPARQLACSPKSPPLTCYYSQLLPLCSPPLVFGQSGSWSQSRARAGARASDLKLRTSEKAKAEAEGKKWELPDPDSSPHIRSLDMEDMRQAMDKVRSSIAADAESMLELTQWNEQYGEGGTRKTTPLSYFL
eukprot:jgi/Mesen1/1752/ME001390S00741